MEQRLRVLFTGYAHVHFICFKPLFDRLKNFPGVEVSVSGGLRTKTAEGYLYDEQGMYGPFALEDYILPVDEIRERDFDVVFAGNTKMILPRSASKRIQIFHGLSYRNKAIRPDNMSWDHYFIIGPYMRRRFAAAGLLAEGDERAVPIGFMKTDRLLNGELDRAGLWHKFGLDGERPIILYAPTGAKKNSLELMGEEVIAQLSACDKYDLLIKPHDHPKNRAVNWFERLARFESPHCRLVREPDVIEPLYVADVLITDASSVASEFSLLDRPMVFLDTPELIADALAAEHSMTDLETWGRNGGLVVKQPGEVTGAIEYCLHHPREGSDVRRAMAKDLFYNPGTATDAAMTWLMEHVLDRRANVVTAA